MLKSALTTVLLGEPGRHRLRVVMTLWTLLVYLLFVVLLLTMQAYGLIETRTAFGLGTYCVLGSAGFYLLLRSRLSERMSVEPSLMVWQNLHSVLAVIWAYSAVAPVRGAVLAILVLIVAYGMFALSARQARWLALLSLLLLAAAMLWKSRTDPQAYPASVEAVHLAVVTIVLLGVSALSIRMGALRKSLRRQKQELEASLEQIRVLATQDELTGLVNRRHMMDMLRAEQARQQRSGRGMSLVLIDLDHFKRINDGFGHQVGDAVLRTFVDSVLHSLRGTDVLARWGGEEFLLMLPDTQASEALQTVQRMRDSLMPLAFEAISPNLELTFSAGLATCQPGDSIEAVIDQADQAMYRAKEAGRNCTVCI